MLIICGSFGASFGGSNEDGDIQCFCEYFDNRINYNMENTKFQNQQRRRSVTKQRASKITNEIGKRYFPVDSNDPECLIAVYLDM